MTLKPNDTNSVYIDYETEDDTSDGVYPNQGNGTSQPLHFQATLKQDGNIAIEPGEFKATSTFQVTYPDNVAALSPSGSAATDKSLPPPM